MLLVPVVLPAPDHDVVALAVVHPAERRLHVTYVSPEGDRGRQFVEHLRTFLRDLERADVQADAPVVTAPWQTTTASLTAERERCLLR